VFVPNFTDQFFQNILHGDNSQRAAEIIYDHGNVGLLMLEHFQNVADLRVLVNEQGQRYDFCDGLIRHFAVDIEILLA